MLSMCKKETVSESEKIIFNEVGELPEKKIKIIQNKKQDIFANLLSVFKSPHYIR